jgi:hypothetical protein
MHGTMSRFGSGELIGILVMILTVVLIVLVIKYIMSSK